MTEIPVVKVDRRIAMPRNELKLVTKTNLMFGLEKVEYPVLIGRTLVFHILRAHKNLWAGFIAIDLFWRTHYGDVRDKDCARNRKSIRHHR